MKDVAKNIGAAKTTNDRCEYYRIYQDVLSPHYEEWNKLYVQSKITINKKIHTYQNARLQIFKKYSASGLECGV